MAYEVSNSDIKFTSSYLELLPAKESMKDLNFTDWSDERTNTDVQLTRKHA
jgi:hypothetical protein